jgi:hypothetical protein
MIAMSMCDNRAFYRLPGINIKISCGAIDAFIGECKHDVLNWDF